MSRTIRPLRGHVLVQQDAKQTTTASGLHLPQGSERWPQLATVMRVGPEIIAPNGVVVPCDVQVGDRVLFKRRPSSALDPDSREGASDFADMLMLKFDDILAVVEDEEVVS